SRCKGEYAFDPEKDGDLVGGELLGLHARPAWKKAWNRFAAAPARYAGLVDLLRRAKPEPKAGDLRGNLAAEAWPQDNEAEEQRLRRALQDLTKLAVPSARTHLRELDAAHGPRREWVWSRLGKSSLAEALRHLGTLADATAAP